MSSTTRSAESLRDDARRAGDKASNAFGEVKSILGHAAETGSDMASAEYDRLRKGVDELLQILKQAGSDSAEKARGAVKAKPVTSLAGAFAVGFIAALLIRR